MKTHENFIKEYFEKVTNKFKDVKISYKLEDLDGTYIIKIEPKIHFEKVKNFLVKDEKMTKLFSQKYLFNGILFINEDSFINFENADFETKGLFYDLTSLFKSLNIDLSKIESFPILNITFNPKEKDDENDERTTYNFEKAGFKIELPSNAKLELSFTDNKSNKENIEYFLNDNSKEFSSSTDEDSFSLAA